MLGKSVKHSQLLNSTDVMFIALDLSNKVTFVNTKVCEILGFEKDLIINKNWFNYFVPDKIKSESELKIKKFLEKNEPQNFQNLILTKSLEEKLINWHFTVLYDQCNNSIGYLISGKELIENNEEVEKLFEINRIIERSSAIVFLWKKQNNWPVKFVSKNVEKILGYSVKDFMSGKIVYSDLIHKEDLPRVSKEVEDNSKLKSSFFLHTPYRVFNKKGEILWVKDDTFIRRNNKNEITHFEGVIIDITKKIETEIKLKNQNEDFARLNEEYKISNQKLSKAKLKAEKSESLKMTFLANMSHEIRTPMNAILGFSSLLKKHDLSKEKKEKYLDLINSGGKKLLTIISDILDISKIDASQLSINYGTYNLNLLLDNLYNQFSMQNKNSNISFSLFKGLADDKCFIETDEVRLSQILSNLLENAKKNTRVGKIEFGYTIKGTTLQFYVRDTGVGIKPELFDVIFERFNQVDNNKISTIVSSGTGLGLSIVKGLVELLNGKVWLESKINIGSTFNVTIPYVPKLQIVSKIKKNENIVNLNNSAQTILIAEDDKANFIYLKDLLKEYNYNIIHASNGKEAVDLFNKSPNIKLILMDVKMPVLDGIEALKLIRKVNKSIPIVAQTAFAMADDKEKLKKIGFNEYIAKPILEVTLLKIINKYIF